MEGPGEALDGEAFPASTCARDVGVVEDELGRDLVLLEVHFGPEKGQLGLSVHQDPARIKDERDAKESFSDFLPR